MKGIHVDLKTRTVRAQPGCNLGDLDREIGDAREILTYGKPGIGAEGANDTFCRIHYICID
jgi:FAD/FMN-containing dehydrogenase